MNPAKDKRALVVLLMFLLLAVGGGGLMGLTVDTGGWYADLVKPNFNPPNWLFAPVWTTLYVLIGIAGWRVWNGGELAAARVWWLQMVLNFAWPPIFFAVQWTGVGLVVILALLAAIVWFIKLTIRSGDRVAAGLFLPYAAWVAYASLLNGAIWWLN